MIRFAFILLLIPSKVFAWSCDEYDKYNQPFSKHIEIASNIFLGQVVSGTYDQARGYNREVMFKVKLGHEFKGKLDDIIELHTGYEQLVEGVVLGESYVFFLYGSHELDSCGHLLPIGPYSNTLKRLENMVVSNEHFKTTSSLDPELARITAKVKVLLNVSK